MFEEILTSIGTYSPMYVYFILLVIPFIENIFPPSPSDVIVVIAGTLIVLGQINFIPALIVASAGSEIGFLFLFYLGKQADKKIIQAGKMKFISRDALFTAEQWFNKYGFAIILMNRFISGVRSIIAFFAGVSELPVKKTILLSSISSILWHAALLALGVIFGENIHAVDKYLAIYSTVVTIIIIIGIAIACYFFFRKKKNEV